MFGNCSEMLPFPSSSASFVFNVASLGRGIGYASFMYVKCNLVIVAAAVVVAIVANYALHAALSCHTVDICNISSCRYPTYGGQCRAMLV
mmetsp:Transcript_19967/g.35589  ORF Transcript_19967/g.35589 Transcript_19967/m.35589 type:complete len:90 (-) Transcript_19967:257-526(-)